MNTVSLAQCLTQGNKVAQGSHFYQLHLVFLYVLILGIAQEKLVCSHGSLLYNGEQVLSPLGPRPLLIV